MKENTIEVNEITIGHLNGQSEMWMKEGWYSSYGGLENIYKKKGCTDYNIFVHLTALLIKQLGIVPRHPEKVVMSKGAKSGNRHARDISRLNENYKVLKRNKWKIIRCFNYTTN